MAARDHRVSRRALLGAAWAVSTALAASPRKRGSSPCLVAPPERMTSWTPDQVRGDGRWGRSLAHFRRAEAALDAAAHEPDDDIFDAINAAFNNALRRLLRTPAPDLAALADKIELGIDQEIATLTGGESCLASLKRDTRRLCRQG